MRPWHPWVMVFRIGARPVCVEHPVVHRDEERVLGKWRSRTMA
jgi:hypothetical protein